MSDAPVLGSTVEVRGLDLTEMAPHPNGYPLRGFNGAIGKLTRSRSVMGVGSHVQAHSLVKMKELNGEEGTIVRWHEDLARGGRWEVRMANGNVVALKPANLRLAQGAIGWHEIPKPEGVSPIVIWVQQERMNAFVSGRHCRLGALSPVLTLTDLALKLIADEVLSGLDVLLSDDNAHLLLKGMRPAHVKWISGTYAPGSPLSVATLRFCPGEQDLSSERILLN